jgi:two-component system nitrate/nitrite response regulator NarL
MAVLPNRYDNDLMSDRVRLLLADDHPIFLEGLVRALGDRPDLELVTTATSGREALEKVREHVPDVALLDLGLPDLDGLAVLHALKRENNPARIVILSAHSDGTTVFSALAAGASGYLSKESTRTQIFEAVRAVARGEVVISPELNAGMVQELQQRSAVERPLLSVREQEVLRMTADGLSAAEIGSRLHLSAATVKTHLHNLYEKLGVSDRAAAVAAAMRRGLLE